MVTHCFPLLFQPAGTGSRTRNAVSLVTHWVSSAFPANWDGFKDEECGIHGYTWSVGTTVCGTDVVSFVDPHSTIHNPDDWTYTGLAKDLHLADGAYYVTVQVSSSCCCCLYPSPPLHTHRTTNNPTTEPAISLYPTLDGTVQVWYCRVLTDLPKDRCANALTLT